MARARRAVPAGWPSRSISPSSARSRPASTRSRVVLPAPLSPWTSSASPASTLKSSGPNTGSSLRAKRKPRAASSGGAGRSVGRHRLDGCGPAAAKRSVYASRRETGLSAVGRRQPAGEGRQQGPRLSRPPNRYGPPPDGRIAGPRHQHPQPHRLAGCQTRTRRPGRTRSPAGSRSVSSMPATSQPGSRQSAGRVLRPGRGGGSRPAASSWATSNASAAWLAESERGSEAGFQAVMKA